MVGLVDANATDRSGARWPVGPGGAWEHEVGMRAQRAATVENWHGGPGLRAVTERAVAALTGRRTG